VHFDKIREVNGECRKDFEKPGIGVSMLIKSNLLWKLKALIITMIHPSHCQNFPICTISKTMELPDLIIVTLSKYFMAVTDSQYGKYYHGNLYIPLTFHARAFKQIHSPCLPDKLRGLNKCFTVRGASTRTK
jgi:hypothetical protein